MFHFHFINFGIQVDLAIDFKVEFIQWIDRSKNELNEWIRHIWNQWAFNLCIMINACSQNEYSLFGKKCVIKKRNNRFAFIIAWFESNWETSKELFTFLLVQWTFSIAIEFMDGSVCGPHSRTKYWQWKMNHRRCSNKKQMWTDWVHSILIWNFDAYLWKLFENVNILSSQVHRAIESIAIDSNEENEC